MSAIPLTALSTNRHPPSELPAPSSQFSQTPSFPTPSTDQPPHALLAPVTAYQSTNPGTSNRTGVANNNAEHIPPAVTLAGASHVDASHSVFYQAGRDIHIYPPANRTCICWEKSLYSMLTFNRPTFCYFLTAASTIDGGQYGSYQHMPCHNALFTGRQRYLERLRQYFDLRDSSRPRRAFLLYGMGGAGKTQICMKFVEDSSDL